MYRIITFENGFPEWYSGWDYEANIPIFNSDRNQAIVFMTADAAKSEKNFMSLAIRVQLVVEKIDKNDVI